MKTEVVNGILTACTNDPYEIRRWISHTDITKEFNRAVDRSHKHDEVECITFGYKHLQPQSTKDLHVCYIVRCTITAGSIVQGTFFALIPNDNQIEHCQQMIKILAKLTLMDVEETHKPI